MMKPTGANSRAFALVPQASRAMGMASRFHFHEGRDTIRMQPSDHVSALSA